MVYLYYLYDPGEPITPRYVGKTKNPQMRLYSHISNAKTRPRTYKDHWILKLLDQGRRPEMEVYRTVSDDEDWEELEREAIEEARFLWGDRITNLTDGGECGNTLRGSDRFGWVEKETLFCQFCGESFEAYKSQLDKPENKDKRFKYCSVACSAKANKNRSIPIIGTSPDGEVFHFVSAVEAVQRYPELNRSNIAKVLKGKYRQHKGWVFEYASQ